MPNVAIMNEMRLSGVNVTFCETKLVFSKQRYMITAIYKKENICAKNYLKFNTLSYFLTYIFIQFRKSKSNVFSLDTFGLKEIRSANRKKLIRYKIPKDSQPQKLKYILIVPDHLSCEHLLLPVSYPCGHVVCFYNHKIFMLVVERYKRGTKVYFADKHHQMAVACRLKVHRLKVISTGAAFIKGRRSIKLLCKQTGSGEEMLLFQKCCFHS